MIFLTKIRAFLRGRDWAIQHVTSIMDPNSLSRPDLCLCKHLHFNLDVLFEKKVVTGSLRLTAINMQAANNQLVSKSSLQCVHV